MNTTNSQNFVPEQNSHKEEILQAIREGTVSMRPRWYFIVRGFLAGLGLFIVFLVSLYFASLLLFVMRGYGIIETPGFGMRGWLELLLALPWLLIALSMIFLGLSYLLVKQYAFIYRQPLIYSFVFIVVLSIAGTCVIDVMGMHQGMRRSWGGVPPNGPGMSPAMMIMRGFDPGVSLRVHRGVVREASSTGVMFTDLNGEQFMVLYDESTRFPGRREVWLGDDIVVLGETLDGRIFAEGVRVIGRGK